MSHGLYNKSTTPHPFPGHFLSVAGRGNRRSRPRRSRWGPCPTALSLPMTGGRQCTAAQYRAPDADWAGAGAAVGQCPLPDAARRPLSAVRCPISASLRAGGAGSCGGRAGAARRGAGLRADGTPPAAAASTGRPGQRGWLAPREPRRVHTESRARMIGIGAPT